MPPDLAQFLLDLVGTELVIRHMSVQNTRAQFEVVLVLLPRPDSVIRDRTENVFKRATVPLTRLAPESFELVGEDILDGEVLGGAWPQSAGTWGRRRVGEEADLGALFPASVREYMPPTDRQLQEIVC
jgi:hypothetical protein